MIVWYSSSPTHTHTPCGKKGVCPGVTPRSGMGVPGTWSAYYSSPVGIARGIVLADGRICLLYPFPHSQTIVCLVDDLLFLSTAQSMFIRYRTPEVFKPSILCVSAALLFLKCHGTSPVETLFSVGVSKRSLLSPPW